MKNLRFFTIAMGLMLLVSSCSVFRGVGNALSSVTHVFSKKKPKEGCPSNGKNVGAEKILSGDPKAMKDVKKAKKFRS
jgi:hypothetical protein